MLAFQFEYIYIATRNWGGTRKRSAHTGGFCGVQNYTEEETYKELWTVKHKVKFKYGLEEGTCEPYIKPSHEYYPETTFVGYLKRYEFFESYGGGYNSWESTTYSQYGMKDGRWSTVVTATTYVRIVNTKEIQYNVRAEFAALDVTFGRWELITDDLIAVGIVPELPGFDVGGGITIGWKPEEKFGPGNYKSATYNATISFKATCDGNGRATYTTGYEGYEWTDFYGNGAKF